MIAANIDYALIVQSCDVYFYNVGNRTGIDKIAEYAEEWLTQLGLVAVTAGMVATRLVLARLLNTVRSEVVLFAGVALIGAEYLTPVFFPGATPATATVQVTAVVLILVLLVINFLGIKTGAWAQNVLSVLKVGMIGVLAAVISFLYEVKRQSRLKQSESIMKLSPWFNISAVEMQEAIAKTCSMEFKDYDDYLAKYDGKPEQTLFKVLANYYEGMGVLVKRRLMDADVVYDFWGDIIISSWEQFEPVIKGMRKDYGDPSVLMFWESLYNDLKVKGKNL
jgi:hypothetical protein